MTPKELKKLIEGATGVNVSCRKNKGSMKEYYTYTFRKYGPVDLSFIPNRRRKNFTDNNPQMEYKSICVHQDNLLPDPATQIVDHTKDQQQLAAILSMPHLVKDRICFLQINPNV